VPETGLEAKFSDALHHPRAVLDDAIGFEHLPTRWWRADRART